MWFEGSSEILSLYDLLGRKLMWKRLLLTTFPGATTNLDHIEQNVCLLLYILDRMWDFVRCCFFLYFGLSLPEIRDSRFPSSTYIDGRCIIYSGTSRL